MIRPPLRNRITIIDLHTCQVEDGDDDDEVAAAVSTSNSTQSDTPSHESLRSTVSRDHFKEFICLL